MSNYNILMLCCLLLCKNSFGISSEPYEENASILKKCLNDESGNTTSTDLQKLESFDSWNETERLPCFSHCLSVNKGWFDATGGKWIQSKLEADLSANVYKYCEQELDQSYEHVCDFAYRGFRCLRKAAYHTTEVYMTIFACGIELHADLEELQKYIALPNDEPVPCLFQCFADKFKLYTPDYEWNLDNWIKALGPLKATTSAADYKVCSASAEEKKDEAKKCVWMYKEYLCLKNVNKSEEASVL